MFYLIRQQYPGRVRKALDRLFVEPPNSLIRLIRSTIGDDTIKPAQIKGALKRLRSQTPEIEIPSTPGLKAETKVRGIEHDEAYHTKGKPQEVVELFRTVDTFCRELNPGSIQRKCLARYITYSYEANIFCSVVLWKSRIRIYLKLNYTDLENPPGYVRDVSNVGRWGVGDVEVAINSLGTLEGAKAFIRRSFEESKSTL